MANLTISQVALRLQISDEQVRRLIDAGQLDAFPISLGQKRTHKRIPEESIIRFENRSNEKPAYKIPPKPTLAFPKKVKLKWMKGAS